VSVQLLKHPHTDCSLEHPAEGAVQKYVDAVGLGTETA